MKFNVNYAMAFIVGILAGLAVLFIAKFIFLKKWGPCKYDERQMLARGKAYRAAFWTLVVYLCLDGLLTLGSEVRWANVFVVYYIGIGLALEVYAVICILNDAYFPLKEKPGFYLTFFGVIIVWSAAVSLSDFLNGKPFVTDGMLNYRIINPVIVVVFAGIFITLLARRLAEKRHGAEE